MVVPLEAFAGHQVLANSVRLFIIFTGITLALLAVRLSFGALMRRELDRFWGSVSFAFIIITPAISGLLRFGEPLVWETAASYLVGLLAGVVAFAYQVVLSPPWRRYQRRRQVRTTVREAERAREDADRRKARQWEDDALTYDRKREDDLLGGARAAQDNSDKRRAP